jgi:hypothetical protein
MTEKYLGGYLTKTPVLPTADAAPGIWKLDEAIYALKANTWPTPITVPSPVFSIDFTRSSEIDPRLIFVRNSVASYYNEQGILTFADSAELRIDHDPITGEKLGALIEEFRTNLLQRSEEIGNVYWTQSNVTVTDNQFIAPDGNTTADEIEDLELESEHAISRGNLSINMTSEVYTLSAFVRSDFFKMLRIKIGDDGDNEFYVDFDMNSGGPVLVNSTGSATITNFSSLELPNGWSRVYVTGRTGVNGVHRASLKALDDTGNEIYVGVSGTTYSIWGIQLERGEISSYIKTVSSTASRGDDLLTVLDTSFLNYFSETEGTYVFEGTTRQNNGSKNSTIGACFYLNEDNYLRLVSKGATSSNRLELTGKLESDTTERTFVTYPEYQDFNTPINIKFSIGLKKTEYPKISVNGGDVKTGSTGNSGMFISGVPPIVFLGNFSGQLSATETVQNGHVKRFSYWNTRLSDKLLRYISTQSYLVDVDLALEFDLAETIDSRISFSRNSDASYFNSAGILQISSIDEARIDYNPSSLNNLGLLIEESRTNLITYSEDLTNGIYTKSNVTISGDSAAAPDSNNTADSVLETTTNGEHSISESLAGLDQTQTYYGLSVFVKGINRTKILLEFVDTASSANTVTASVDLSDQSIAEQTTGTGEILDSFVKQLPNDWFRISLAGRTGQSGEHKFSAVVLDDAGQRTFAGDVSKGFLMWGFQIEQGGKTSSYIPTSGATSTRESDVAVISGTNFSTWFNQSEGSFYWKGDTQGYVTTPAIGYEVNDNTALESLQLVISDTNAVSSRISVIDGGSSVATLDSPNPRTATGNSMYVNGFVYKADDFYFKDKNAEASTDTAGTLPTVTQMSIGSSFVADSATKFLNGHISKILYWNRALPVWRISDIVKS